MPAWCLIPAVIALQLMSPAAGQTNPSRPSKEYVRLGGRVIAVENSCRISGRALNGASGVSGVAVTLTGTHTDSATTDAGGNYAFANLRCEGSYTVSAAKAGYNFNPPSTTYAPLAQDQTATNFNAAVVYSITGRVTVGGAGFSGVTVILSGTQAGSTTTDTSGNYSFSGLAASGDYTVTPSQTGYTYSPPNRTYNSLSANQTGADFTATRITYTISGQITLGGSGMSGVTVTLTGTQGGSTTTDSGGNYSFAGLGAGGNYTITPSRSGYTFSPASLNYTNLSSNQTGANFAPTLLTYCISGRVTLSGTGVSAVTVTLTGTQGSSTTTDASGNYSFCGLAGGGNYTVTPSRLGYAFSPASLTYNNLSANQAAANFTASTVTYSISGRVTEGVLGVSGVTMSLTGSQTSSIATDANGYYAFSGLAAGGGYTVTPSKTNFTFSPASTTFSSLSANQTANFTGNQYPLAASVWPYSGSTRRQTFTFVFRDPDGYSDLEWAMAEINGTLGGGSGCVLYYQLNDPSHVYLGDNTYNPQWRQATPGSGSAVTTSQGLCRLYPATSSLTRSGTDATLSMDLEFLPAFSGSKGIWMAEKDYSHASNTNWMRMGGWTVPAQISGQVTMGSSGLSGVTVTVSGSCSGSTVTDAYGNYSMDVFVGGTCIVTPSKTYYMFTPSSTQVPGNGTQTANFAVTATVSITNLTRPGHNTDFKVGDNWTLTINGPPNQTVGVTVTQNGGGPSSASYGQTSSTGSWTLSGGMGTGEVGNWTEAWTVGPVKAIPTLVFTVSP